MTMKEKKQTVLNEVLTAYETYQGERKSRLEELLNALRKEGKLTKEDSDKLTSALIDYRLYILGTLANSWRVRVNFNKEQTATRNDNKNYPFADLDLDKLFEPLPDLDD